MTAAAPPVTPATDGEYAAFEAALTPHVAAKDFAGWRAAAGPYRDWLEERGHPLAPMAAALATAELVEVFVARRNGTRNVWMWRLHLPLPHPPGAVPRHTRWHAQHRTNGASLLGVPPTWLRLKGYDERADGRWSARFTVVFSDRARSRLLLPRGAGGWVDLRREPRVVPVPHDTDLHPWGFARVFWPPGWLPSSEYREPPAVPTPALPGLFDDPEGEP